MHHDSFNSTNSLIGIVLFTSSSNMINKMYHSFMHISLNYTIRNYWQEFEKTNELRKLIFKFAGHF